MLGDQSSCLNLGTLSGHGTHFCFCLCKGFYLLQPDKDETVFCYNEIKDIHIGTLELAEMVLKIETKTSPRLKSIHIKTGPRLINIYKKNTT